MAEDKRQPGDQAPKTPDPESTEDNVVPHGTMEEKPSEPPQEAAEAEASAKAAKAKNNITTRVVMEENGSEAAPSEPSREEAKSDVPGGMPAEKSPERQQWDKKMAQQPIILTLCPKCGQPAIPIHYNDKGTPDLYKCSRCEEETTNPNEKTYKPMMSTHIDSYCDGDSKIFNPAMFARELIDLYFLKTDKKTDTIYVYNGETWDSTGEIFIKQTMAEVLQVRARQHHFTEIAFNVRINTYTDLTETPDKLVVNNGILDVKTGKLESFNPGYFIVAKLPVTYDKGADCPLIKKFLLDVFGAEQEPIIKKFVGYCLESGYLFAVILLLLGDGSNGKSTFLNLLEAFLGKDNCSHIPFQELCNDKFAKADLYRKLANTCGDLTSEEITNLGVIKRATGTDPIYARYIYGKGFDFYNSAKMIYSANQAPYISEDTEAAWRRILAITCPNKFTGDKCDPNILQKITTPQELSGFLNYALEGLRELHADGRFKDTDAEATRADYLRKSNSRKAWIEERVEFINDPNAWVEGEELYQKYILFCNKEGLPTTNKAQLTSAMHEYCPQVKKAQRRILGKQQWGWAFVTVKSATATPPAKSGQTTLGKNTTVTDVTSVNTVQKNRNQNLEVKVDSVTPVTPQPGSKKTGDEDNGDSKIDGYRQFSCYFCGEPIMDDNWVSDDFTENKPAHKSCYKQKKSELKGPEQNPSPRVEAKTERDESEDYPEPGDEF